MSDPVTAAQFKEAKPAFALVADATVEAYIALAGLVVDSSWPDTYYAPATIAYTCHLMTLDGLGSNAESAGFRAGSFDTIRSGALSLARYRAEAEGTHMNWLKQTVCGRQYHQYLYAVRGGPRVVSGAVDGFVSGYAKDHPFYGWY